MVGLFSLLARGGRSAVPGQDKTGQDEGGTWSYKQRTVSLDRPVRHIQHPLHPWLHNTDI